MKNDPHCPARNRSRNWTCSRAAVAAFVIAAWAHAPNATSATPTTSGGPIDYATGFAPGVPSTPQAGRATSKFKYIYSSPASWPGAVHWRYNHANAPQQWTNDKAGAIQLISDAAAKWSAACGVQFVYDGETTVAPYTMQSDGTVDRVNVIGWQSLTNGMYGATYWTVGMQPDGKMILIDADTALDPFFVGSTTQLTRTMAHEWGHVVGLGHSNLADTLMSGPPDTSYSNLPDLTTDDVHGCRCLYGTPRGQQAGNVCSLPDEVDFGTLDIGTASSPYQLNVTNNGSATMTLYGIHTGGGEFAIADSLCLTGLVLAPGQSCVFSLTVRAAASGERADQVVIDSSEGAYRVPLVANGRSVAPPPPPPAPPAASLPPVAPVVDVIEFYNAQLDHYFISALPGDINALDSGQTPGWARTGLSFKAFSAPGAGLSPVCRIYIPAPWGQSHFYSASPTECADTMARFPQFVLESSAVMYVAIPDTVTGACPQGYVPIYRVWNKRSDTNHRYTTDRALRDAMVARGYVAEGYGPDAVIMCGAP
jgi:hypothetical protein